MKRVKKLVALLLTAALMLSLLTVSSFAALASNFNVAASNELGQPNNYTSMSSLVSKESTPANSVIFRLVDAGNGYAKVDIGLYKVSSFDNVQVNLSYDSNVVSLVTADNSRTVLQGKSARGGGYDPPSDSDVLKAFSFYTFGESSWVFVSDTPSSEDLETALEDETYGLFVALAANVKNVELDFDSSSGAMNGHVKMFFQNKQEFNGYYTSSILKILGTGNKLNTSTSGDTDVFWCGYMMFKLADNVSFDQLESTAFGTFSTTAVPAGVAAGESSLGVSGQVAQKAYFLNFPAKTYTITTTVDGATTGTVKFYEANDAGNGPDTNKQVGPTYDVGAQGKLYLNSELATVKLPAGDYYAVYSTGGGAETISSKLEVRTSNTTLGITPGTSGGGGGSGNDPDPATGYALKLIDKESEHRDAPFAVGTVAQVKINDGEYVDKTVDSNGYVEIPGDKNTENNIIKIKATGYTETTLSGVTFSNDGATIQVNNTNVSGFNLFGLETVTEVDMNAKRTAVTVPAAGATSYVVITAKNSDGTGVTPNMFANELPMVVPSNGTVATASLPDGDYVFTLVTPGSEDAKSEVEINATDGDGLKDSDAGGPTAGTVRITPLDAAGAPAGEGVPTTITGTGTNGTGGTAGTTGSPAGGTPTPAPISYPTYIVEGTWGENSATFDISLIGTNATSGTFGIKYDTTNLFDTGDSSITKFGIKYFDQVSSSESIEIHSADASAVAATLTNPTKTNGVLLMQWNAESVIAAKNSKVQIATIKIPYKSGIDSQEKAKPYITENSVTVLDFRTTAWASSINTAITDATDNAIFTEQFFRLTNAHNDVPLAHRLTPDKAATFGSEKGFYQTFSRDYDVAEADDTMMQITYVTYDAVEQKIPVKDGSGAGIGDVTLTITVDGVAVMPAPQTDNTGAYSLTTAKGKPINVTATKEGYITKSATGTTGTTPIEIILTSSASHKVEILHDQQDKIALTGGDAYNGADYSFSLAAKTGYTWASYPAAGDIVVTMQTATWNDSSNAIPSHDTTYTVTAGATPGTYKISGINDSDTSKKVIIAVASGKEPVTDTTSKKITTSVGIHGTAAAVDAGTTSTFNPGDTVDNKNGTAAKILTETTDYGETASATYTFEGAGPCTTEDAAKKDANQDYYAWIIEKLIINGTEQTLTDKEAIEGKSVQLTGITGDQAMVVTFGKAKVNGDTIIDPPTPDPMADANVFLSLSDHGKAGTVYNADAQVATDVTGMNNLYVVKAGKNFDATILADSDYEIDTVTVDGVVVNNPVVASKWDAEGKKVTLNSVLGGSTHNIVVTFKTVGGPSMYATVETVNRGGAGSVSPVGTQILPVGYPASFTFTPAKNTVKLVQLDVAYPGGAVQDKYDEYYVTGTQTAPAVNEPVTFTTSNLVAGTTVIGYGFDDTAAGAKYKVEMVIDYGINLASISTATAANVTFVKNDGTEYAYGPDKTGEYHMAKAGAASKGTYQFNLPAGTYTVKIAKKGYLNYTISGFTINAGGTAVNAETVDNVIKFGKKDDTATQVEVKLVSGDATWDGGIIALNDIAQVANGMLSNATAAQIKHGDIDETGAANAVDMGYVVAKLGARDKVCTYDEFAGAGV